MTAQWLFTAGIIGCLAVGALSSEMKAESEIWSKAALAILATSMLLGAFLLWIFGWKFYFRTQSRSGVIRDCFYFAILLGFTCLAPLVFMMIEGKDSFFDEVFS